MKILICNDNGTPTGGAERMSFMLREQLRARGHDARFLSSTARPLPNEPILSDYQTFGTEGPLSRIVRATNPLAARTLRRVLAEFRPDVVHVRMFLWQLSPMILRELRDVPALLHVVNYDLICPINTKTLPDGSPCHVTPGRECIREGCIGYGGLLRRKVQERYLDRDFDAAFDRVIVNSEWVGERLRTEGVRVDGVVWNGVKMQPARPPLDPQAPPTIGYAGRLVPKKGVSFLLDVVAEVHRTLPDVRLLIAGDGPERSALERKASDLGLAEHATFLGHLDRDALEQAFAGVWVQAAPSLWEEPFGLVAAEAMMRGCPAVVTATGGLAEQVIAGVTGHTFPPGDRAAWSTGLARLLADREFCERMGAAGRERALAEFTEARVIDRFEQIYSELTTHPG